MSEKIYYSMQQVKEGFFPKQAREEMLEAMTDKERKRFLIEEMVDKAMSELRQSCQSLGAGGDDEEV